MLKPGLIVLMVLGGASEALACQDSCADLAKELSNPFSDIYNIPINQNPDFGMGPDDRGWQYFLTVQPVIPIHLTEDWNILSRTILPVIYRDSGGESDFGLGDSTEALFFSPRVRTPAGWSWGIGPVFLLPTATNDNLGQEKWGAGPTLGLLNQAGPWTFGLLANTIWSFAGSGPERVHTSFLQPILDYTFDSGTTLSLNTESTYDWIHHQWIVPIHFVVRQVFEFEDRRVSVGLGFRYYAEAPPGGPEWGIRLGITIVLPR
jgi:hypothetical protein